jgi:integrase
MIYEVPSRGKTRYQVRFREPGNRSVRSKTFDTRALAVIFEGQLAQAKAGATEFPAAKISNLTLEAFGVEYRDKYMNVELEKSTRNLYKSTWNNHIAKRIGHLPLSAINRETVQQFKAELLADGVGGPTVDKSLSLLSAVMGKAVEWNRIPYNPVHGVKKVSAKRRHKPEPMPADLVTELISGLPSARDKLIVAVLAYTGMRPGEVLALTKADFDSDSISVDKAIALGEEKDTKTHVDRVVPIMPKLRPFLTDLPDGLLFPRADGRPWEDWDYRNWRKRTFKPAVRKLDVPASELAAYTLALKAWTVESKTDPKAVKPVEPSGEWSSFRPYDLRHTFVSGLLMDGWTPIEVASVAGHSVQVLLTTYAKVISRLKWSKLAAAA